MALNLESIGTPIARIGKKIFYVTDKTDDVNHSMNELKLTKDMDVFQLIPSDRERDIL